MRDQSSKEELNPEVLPLTELVGMDFKSISKIEVQYGDGNRLVIDNQDKIKPIADKLRQVQVKQSTLPGPGYLFFMKIYQDDKVVQVGHTVTLDKRSYKLLGDEVKDLNKIMVEMGRKQFPDLLPGRDV